MNVEIYVLIAASEFVSLVLLVRLWRKKDYLFFKLANSFILLIPVMGPLLYLFWMEAPEAQKGYLQNRGPRGEYTDRWLLIEPLLRRRLNSKNNKSSANEDMDQNSGRSRNKSRRK